MLQNLTIAALIVAILWIIILILYMTVARRQPDVAAQMRVLEEQLDQAEADTEPR